LAEINVIDANINKGKGIKEKERDSNVSAPEALLGFDEHSTWTMFTVFPGTSPSCAFAHCTVLEDSPVILYSLLKLGGEEKPDPSAPFLSDHQTLPVKGSFVPNTCIFPLQVSNSENVFLYPGLKGRGEEPC
jgi:hypothetical protein